MVPISLSRCRLGNYLLAFTACLGLTSMSCFAQSIFFEVGSTPYDHQMIRVARILRCTGGHWNGPTSLAIVNQWMNELHAIPYGYSRQWKTPAEVEYTTAADCKGKAMTLYAQMRTIGARNVRFVIGKHYVADLKTHAWLEWETMNGSYLLDPTFKRTAAKAEEQDSMTYIPFYAYEGGHKYRARNYRSSYATVVAQN